MPRLRYLDRAIDDILEIERFISSESGSNELAEHFTMKLKKQCRRLSELPGRLGRSRPDLIAGFRSFPFGNYIILFTYDDDYLTIVTIVEGHRDINAMMDEL